MEMKRTRAWWSGIASATLMGIATATLAQQSGPVSVSVTIINVANDVAKNTGIDASQIPLNVQVPLDVAATVCASSAEALTRQAVNGIVQCTAQRTASGLDEVVLRQVRGNAAK
jgi:hypothetical protein